MPKKRDDVVWGVWLGTSAKRNMCLAMFQPGEIGAGCELQPDLRMRQMKISKRRRVKWRDARQ